MLHHVFKLSLNIYILYLQYKMFFMLTLIFHLIYLCTYIFVYAVIMRHKLYGEAKYIRGFFNRLLVELV